MEARKGQFNVQPHSRAHAAGRSLWGSVTSAIFIWGQLQLELLIPVLPYTGEPSPCPTDEQTASWRGGAWPILLQPVGRV